MNKPKPDEQPPVAAAKVELSSKSPSLPRTFLDKVYTSRTLITPMGHGLPVVKGQVAATTADQYEFLNNHPDFKPASE